MGDGNSIEQSSVQIRIDYVVSVSETLPEFTFCVRLAFPSWAPGLVFSNQSRTSSDVRLLMLIFMFCLATRVDQAVGTSLIWDFI